MEIVSNNRDLNRIPAGLTRTHSGKLMNVMRPSADMICIEDIAHALSNMPRWGGHTEMFYSVAQHCIFVSRLADDELALAALLHDASEAYLMDLPAPIKVMMPQYRACETKLMRLIYRMHGLPYPINDLVKHWDSIAMHYEWHNIVIGPPPADYPILSPKDAKREFLIEYERVTKLAKRVKGGV